METVVCYSHGDDKEVQFRQYRCIAYNSRINLNVIFSFPVMKLKSFLLCLLLVVCQSLAVFGQSYKLGGRVVGEGNEPLAYTSVVFLHPSDSTRMWFALTEADGTFRVRDIPEGNYSYQILHSGYELLEGSIDLLRDLDMGNIALRKTDITLNEALVKANRIPIVFRGDTMVYNTNSYQVKANATVEEMLKQLPGITVAKDGTVSTQGENVVKVLVNGKEFFGDDPTKATRNINADAVEKVEVLDRKTETTEFSGVDDGTREKVINLVLKEDANKGYFGKIEAGAGTDETYIGKITLNRFNEDNQFTVIGNLNNLNQNGFDWNEYFRMLGGPNGVTLGQRTYWTSQNEWLGRNEDGRQTNAVVGANANFKAGKKGTINSSYFFLDRNNELIARSSSENYIPGKLLFSTSGRNNHSANGQHKLSSTYRLNRDTLNFVTLQGEISYSFGESRDSSFNLNRGEEANVLNHVLSRSVDVKSTFNYKWKATYLRKFKKNKNVLTLESGMERNNSDDTLRWGNSVRVQEHEPNVPLPFSMADHKSGSGLQVYNAAGINLPLKARPLYSFDFRIENKLARDSFDQRRFELKADSLQSGQSPYLGSSYTNTKFQTRFLKNYQKEGWYFNVGLAYLQVQLNRNLELSGLADEVKKDQVGFILPSFYAGFRKMQTERMNIWFNSEEVLPGVNQLNPIYNVVNPLSRNSGNLNLLPYAQYNGGVSYYKRNPAKQRSFHAWGNAGMNSNGILTTELRDTSNFSSSTLLNGNKSSWGGGDLGYSFPVEKLGLDVDISGGYSFYSYFNEQNGIRFQNIQHSVDFSIDFELTLGPLVLDMGYAPDFSIQNSELFGKQNYWRHDLYGDMIVSFGERLEWNTECNVFLFSSSAVGSQQVVPILNSGITWAIDSSNTWELSLLGYDILNRAQSIDRNFFSNGYSETRLNTLTRYFMINLAYSIRKGKKKEKDFRW